MSDTRAIRPVDDGAVGTDDVHDAAVFQRAFFHFVRFKTFGVPSGDVAPQSPRGGRAELGRDARPWVLQERKDRRRALKNVAYGVPINVKTGSGGGEGRGGEGLDSVFFYL
jgi:hypothetical protein